MTLYGVIAEQHDIAQALIVGYEGGEWARDNNAYLQEIAPNVPWMRPLAFIHDPSRLDRASLEQLRSRSFVGISLYLHTDDDVAALKHVPDSVWDWFIEQRWLISVNSQGEQWRPWRVVLECYPELRVLISHLGLPKAFASAPSIETGEAELSSVRSLAVYPGVHVKLSGFYALTLPEHDYPHQAAWPYVEILRRDFGVNRLLWGSDFSPSLERLSFPQTLDLFAKMSFLTDQDRQNIEGENLLALLKSISS